MSLAPQGAMISWCPYCHVIEIQCPRCGRVFKRKGSRDEARSFHLPPHFCSATPLKIGVSLCGP